MGAGLKKNVLWTTFIVAFITQAADTEEGVGRGGYLRVARDAAVGFEGGGKLLFKNMRLSRTRT